MSEWTRCIDAINYSLNLHFIGNTRMYRAKILLLLIIVIVGGIVFRLSIVFRLIRCGDDKFLFRLSFRGYDFSSSH